MFPWILPIQLEGHLPEEPIRIGQERSVLLSEAKAAQGSSSTKIAAHRKKNRQKHAGRESTSQSISHG